MIIEEPKALGASLLFVPEGRAFTVPAPGNVSSTVMPDPNDTSWVDFLSVQKWKASRQNKVDHKVYDSSIGKKVLYDYLQLGGDLEYEFECNVLLGFIIGLFFRTAAPLDGNSFQFNPDAAMTPRGWLILDNRDQNGNLILAANLWGRLEYTGEISGGDGAVVVPKLTFYQLKNSLNTLSLGTNG